ncbi:MAG: ABC transporter substrate-binding protein, partial [Actinobacteria bacterium]|nr:ABC transporter substrate-binding protein [Actinomycetota bacterium]
TSNPDHGFTADTLELGTILPLTGALRPIGEQTARVMKVTVDYINSVDHLRGHLSHINWGCPSRPGVYGRKLSLKIFSLQSSTPEEALAGMRRLIDVEKVFAVRDCYLQTSLMGPATQYQGSKGVPAIWCHYQEMPVPALAPWNFSPGIDPYTQIALHMGYLLNELGKERIGILADPTAKDTNVQVALNIAEHFGHPIPESCVVLKRSQEAANGMRSEVAALRTCYGGRSPDAVLALDALQGVFGSIAAERLGWRGADNEVQWACTIPSCWVTALAKVCADACEGMLTDCATLPCVPWASAEKYPSVEGLRFLREQYLSGEPEDAVTYGPAAITSGIALWLAMTGPDLSREGFADTVGNLRDWSSGIGPILNTSPGDHFGARAAWLIRYTGGAPWFDDVTGDFITIDDVGVPPSLTRL